jgi:hypothetical protein
MDGGRSSNAGEHDRECAPLARQRSNRRISYASRPNPSRPYADFEHQGLYRATTTRCVPRLGRILLGVRCRVQRPSCRAYQIRPNRIGTVRDQGQGHPARPAPPRHWQRPTGPEPALRRGAGRRRAPSRSRGEHAPQRRFGRGGYSYWGGSLILSSAARMSRASSGVSAWIPLKHALSLAMCASVAPIMNIGSLA